MSDGHTKYCYSTGADHQCVCSDVSAQLKCCEFYEAMHEKELDAMTADRDRWKTVALCHACKPTQGNYCPDHYRMMNAPSPWTSHGNPRSI